MNGKRNERLRVEEVSNIVRNHPGSSVLRPVFQGKAIMTRLISADPLFFSVFRLNLPRLSPSELARERPRSIVAKPADLPYCFCPTQ